ncbi:MAG: DUF5677 domain-containing protein [Bacteroidia bacterium]
MDNYSEIHFEFTIATAKLDLLIKTAIEIGNRMKGKQFPENSPIYYSEGLGQKIINHILSVRNLLNGYQFSYGEILFAPKLDYSSIFVLTRAALETYLALNYVFIAENNETLKQFRFLCWDLAGYIERKDMTATTEEDKIKKQVEAEAIATIKRELAENPIFKLLEQHDQKKALKGEWRLNFKWHDLAMKAGFSEAFFRQQYKFLCCYAHASRLSVIQIQQNKTIEQQKEMVISAIDTLLMVLAKHMYDYIEIMPELKEIKNDMTKYQIILNYKYIGDNFLQPNKKN